MDFLKKDGFRVFGKLNVTRFCDLFFFMFFVTARSILCSRIRFYFWFFGYTNNVVFFLVQGNSFELETGMAFDHFATFLLDVLKFYSLKQKDNIAPILVSFHDILRFCISICDIFFPPFLSEI